MSDHSLRHNFHRMAHLMRRAHHHMPPGSAAARLGFDPERGQGRILHLLLLHDGVSQRDIAFTLDIRPQSLGELIRKLEAAKLIERRASGEDKRVHLVYLTDEGRAVATELSSPGGRIEPFAALDDDEREQLAALLEKAADGLAEQIGEDDPHEHRHCHRHGPRA